MRGGMPKLGILLGGLLLVGSFGLLLSHFIAERSGRALEVDAIAHQWWWEFYYPGLGVKVADELRLPEGQPVRLVLTSADVLHSFWLPPMKRAIDVIPGKKRTLLLAARSRGTLYGSCDTGCGCNTVCMRFRVLIGNESEFDKWIGKLRGASLKPRLKSTPPCVLNPNVDGARSPTASDRLTALLAGGNDSREVVHSRSSAP